MTKIVVIFVAGGSRGCVFPYEPTQFCELLRHGRSASLVRGREGGREGGRVTLVLMHE